MPLNSPSESLYPTDQLQGLDESENFSYKQDEKNYKYIAADLQNDSLIQKKRKFVSLESSQNSTKLLVVKHGHKSFKDSSNSEGKPINKKYLVLYVKGNEQDQCFKEMQEILSESFDLNLDNKLKVIKSHFEKVWTNIEKFHSYGEMTRAFDQETGKYIINSVNDLGITYLEIEKKYQELNENRGVSEEYNRILDELQEILAKMKDIFDKNRNEFQHRAINTVSSVDQSFKKLVSDFKEKTQQLEIAKSNAENLKKLEILEENLIDLQNDCKNAIPSEAAYPQAIFKEKDEIISDIETLLKYSKSLKNLITSKDEINGLQTELNELKDKFANLNARILTGTVNQDTQEVISTKEVESLFEKLQGLLLELETHETKGENKKGIKEKLIQKIDNILKLNKQCSLEELGNAINGANQFIENNKDKASEYTGGFFGKVLGEGHSKLGAIVEKLQRLFAEFLSKLSFNQTNASIDATPKTFVRG